MAIARAVALRSTCRISVGAVVVNSETWSIATGYNGAPKGKPHCDNVGCIKDGENHCVRSVHAEANALLKGTGDVMYVTHTPCIECCKLILNTSVRELYWEQKYHDPRGHYLGGQIQYLSNGGVRVYRL